jgi:hypothetical protein
MRECDCSKSKGRYTSDLSIEISGPCVPLGINNHSFAEAYSLQKRNEMNEPTVTLGEEFKAFFIPENNDKIKRID